MDYIKAAWPIVKENLVGWVLYFLVLGITLGFGVGFFFIPNAIRGAMTAIDDNAAPEIGALFNFDNISGDAIGMILFGVAYSLGMMACGIGALVVGILGFFIPMILAEGNHEPVDAIKASFAGSKEIAMQIFVFMIIAGFVNMLGAMACYIGSLVTGPIVFVAAILYWRDVREQVLAASNG